MTVIIVTFFNASEIAFGNILNAHLKSEKLSSNYLTSTEMTVKKWLGGLTLDIVDLWARILVRPSSVLGLNAEHM